MQLSFPQSIKYAIEENRPLETYPTPNICIHTHTKQSTIFYTPYMIHLLLLYLIESDFFLENTGETWVFPISSVRSYMPSFSIFNDANIITLISEFMVST